MPSILLSRFPIPVPLCDSKRVLHAHFVPQPGNTTISKTQQAPTPPHTAQCSTPFFCLTFQRLGQRAAEEQLFATVCQQTERKPHESPSLYPPPAAANAYRRGSDQTCQPGSGQSGRPLGRHAAQHEREDSGVQPGSARSRSGLPRQPRDARACLGRYVVPDSATFC